MKLFTELHKQASTKFLASGDEVPIGDWLMEHTTLNRRPFNFERYPFQERIANDMHPNLSVIKCSQIGLSTSLSTEIIGENGWTTMGEVAVGDKIFNEEGNLCEVTFKSDVWLNRDCYEIIFDDDTKVITDGSHRWYVDFRTRKKWTGVHSTENMKEFLSRGIPMRIPVASPLETPDVRLPLDPYYLGLLLGDGNLYRGRITGDSEDVQEFQRELESRGMDCKICPSNGSAVDLMVTQGGKGNLFSRRKGLNLTSPEKFVPEEFLFSGRKQRLDLLQGLMDTDGSITKEGFCVFTNTEPKLVSAVEHLSRSLGFKPITKWYDPTPPQQHNRKVISGNKRVARVRFTGIKETPVFRLKRKAERLKSKHEIKSKRPFFRGIVSIEKVSSVPTQCLTVDSPSHLFLVSKSMIPTHNTEIQIRKMSAFLRRMQGTSGIFTMPIEDMAKRLYTTRLSPLMKNDDVFNPPMVDKPVRRQDLIQIGDSWLYLTACNEGPATSIPADILFHDELDLSDEAMIGLFQSRLQNSDYKITQAFSTPTYMGYGVDKNFALTDQFMYLVRCESCGHHQFPMFEHDWVHIPDLSFEVDKLTDMTPEQITGLKLKDAYVKCSKCSSRLNLSDPSLREWVAKHPSRDNFRGYKVNPFSTDRISLEYIFKQLAKYKLNENEKGFHNTVLGEPYSPASAQIPEDAIKACMASHGREVETGSDTAVFMGIDMGAICHITLVGEHTDEGKDPWFLFKTCHASQLSATIADLRKRYNIIQACADRYPYTPEVDALRENTGGMMMPIAYEGKAILAPKKDEAGNLIYYAANRTFALDMVRTSIVSEAAVIAGYTSHKDTLVAHLRDMVREETPEKEPKWVKLNGNDHFFHSMAFALLARRVAEHIFLHNLQDAAMTLSVVGMDMGNTKNDPSDRFRTKGLSNYGFDR